jgi:excisionase family DNA binding protein
VPDEFLTANEIAAQLKLNKQTVYNWIDRGELPAVRVGSRRVRVRRADLERFLDAGATDRGADPEPIEVDEGSVTAWATFGAAMAEAAATLEQADRHALIVALERLSQATNALVDSLQDDRA